MEKQRKIYTNKELCLDNKDIKGRVVKLYIIFKDSKKYQTATNKSIMENVQKLVQKNYEKLKITI